MSDVANIMFIVGVQLGFSFLFSIMIFSFCCFLIVFCSSDLVLSGCVCCGTNVTDFSSGRHYTLSFAEESICWSNVVATTWHCPILWPPFFNLMLWQLFDNIILWLPLDSFMSGLPFIIFCYGNQIIKLHFGNHLTVSNIVAMTWQSRVVAKN